MRCGSYIKKIKSINESYYVLYLEEGCPTFSHEEAMFFVR
jgi:hypothetical protein